MTDEPTSGVEEVNPAAMTERLIDAAVYAETASGAYVSGARKELSDARAAIEQALATPAASPATEPVAWLFQHEETGLTQCVDHQQVEWGFEQNNPRLHKICPLYTHPPASPSPAPAAGKELVARLVIPMVQQRSREPGDAWDQAATALSTLAADKARIEAERDALMKRKDFTASAYERELRAAEARASALEGALRRIAFAPPEGPAGPSLSECVVIARAALSPAKETP